jgi:hypothetical protein
MLSSPVVIRDLLIWFAHYDLYTLLWSNHIFDEWKSVMECKGVLSEVAVKRTQISDVVLPTALVHN